MKLNFGYLLLFIRCILIIAVGVLSFPFFLFLFIFRPFNLNNNYLYAVSIMPISIKILGLNLELRNLEKLKERQPTILISNHQHTLDFFIFGRLLPQRCITLGKNSIAAIPCIGLLYWLAGNILINRKRHKSAIKTMDYVRKKMMEKKFSIVIFPEGTRSWKREVGRFKKGAFYLSYRSKVPLRPIIVSTIHKYVDLTKWRSGKIIVTVLPEIDYFAKIDELHFERINDLMENEILKVRELFIREIKKLDQELE